MKVLLILLLLLAAAIAASISLEDKDNTKISYEGYKVFRIKLSNEIQRLFLHELVKNQELSIWREDFASIDLLASPGQQLVFQNVTREHRIQYHEMITNLQSLIDEEQQPMDDILDDSEFNWRRYHNLNEIENFIDSIATKYSSVAKAFVVGQSYEGRTIKGIKISYKEGNPGIFIEANIHAREWITSATATWLINELLSSEQRNVRELAENIDWYILPVLNVDGFAYTHEKDRTWRKTRQPVSHHHCIGTDGNRNFDTYWGMFGGASHNPCDSNYAGPEPFSEPEIKAVAEYMKANKNRLNIFIALHSYGQVLLSPYGHTTEVVPPNHNDLMRVAKAYADSVANFLYGSKYTYGTSAGAMYLATGASIEYAYDELDIKLSYAIELRDMGRYGFVLPPVQIIPNCEETLAGLMALVKEADQLGYMRVKY